MWKVLPRDGGGLGNRESETEVKVYRCNSVTLAGKVEVMRTRSVEYEGYALYENIGPSGTSWEIMEWDGSADICRVTKPTLDEAKRWVRERCIEKCGEFERMTYMRASSVCEPFGVEVLHRVHGEPAELTVVVAASGDDACNVTVFLGTATDNAIGSERAKRLDEALRMALVAPPFKLEEWDTSPTGFRRTYRVQRRF